MKKKIIGILLIVFGISYAYSGFVSDVEYASLMGVALCLILGFFGLRLLGVIKKKNPKAKPVASRPAAAPAPIQTNPNVPLTPVKSALTQPIPKDVSEQKTIYAPNVIDNCQYVYDYNKVNVRSRTGLDFKSLELGSKLSFAEGESAPTVLLDGQEIGTMLPGRISDMVSDWMKRGEPIFAILESAIPEENLLQLFVVFYRNLIEVAERRGLDKVKLVGNTGKEIQENISFQEVGDLCFALFDEEKEKWEVSAGICTIGYLPAKYDSESITEEAKIVIADIDENYETEKYSVWVYVM